MTTPKEHLEETVKRFKAIQDKAKSLRQPTEKEVAEETKEEET